MNNGYNENGDFFFLMQHGIFFFHVIEADRQNQLCLCTPALVLKTQSSLANDSQKLVIARGRDITRFAKLAAFF